MVLGLGFSHSVVGIQDQGLGFNVLKSHSVYSACRVNSKRASETMDPLKMEGSTNLKRDQHGHLNVSARTEKEWSTSSQCTTPKP